MYISISIIIIIINNIININNVIPSFASQIIHQRAVNSDLHE